MILRSLYLISMTGLGWLVWTISINDLTSWPNPDFTFRDSIPFNPALDLSRGKIEGISALAVADLDDDGRKDVLVLEGGKHAGGRIAFGWLQQPDKKQDTWNYYALPRPASLLGVSPATNFIGAAQIADMNGDGYPDIVVSMDKHSGQVRSAFMYLLINPGSMSIDSNQWQIQEIYGQRPWHHINDMVLEDLNSDGRTDIVIRVLEPNQLVILLQHQHSWQERSLSGVPFGDTGEGFAIGDIDGKGNPDIAIGGYWLETPADIVEGEFISHSVDVAYSTVNSNTKQAIGDINGDGRNDIVISPAEGYRQGANYDLAWYEAPRVLTTSGSWKKHVVASDFNGGHTIKLADIDLDGDLDLVSGVCWNLWGQRKHISLYLFDSNLQEFATPQFISVENGLYTGVLADLDDDGDLDIIGQDEYAGHGRPYFYENRLIR